MAAAFACLLVGCEDEPKAWEPGGQSSAVPSATSAREAPSPTDAPSAEADPSGELEVLDFAFTSGIRTKDPVDTMVAASPGERVYAHLRLRNRTGMTRRVHLVFRVNGSKRTELDLDIEPSWSWRTWGYNTIHASDERGELSLLVTDDQGRTVVERTLPIADKTSTKPR